MPQSTDPPDHESKQRHREHKIKPGPGTLDLECRSDGRGLPISTIFSTEKVLAALTSDQELRRLVVLRDQAYDAAVCAENDDEWFLNARANKVYGLAADAIAGEVGSDIARDLIRAHEQNPDSPRVGQLVRTLVEARREWGRAVCAVRRIVRVWGTGLNPDYRFPRYEEFEYEPDEPRRRSACPSAPHIVARRVTPRSRQHRSRRRRSSRSSARSGDSGDEGPPGEPPSPLELERYLDYGRVNGLLRRFLGCRCPRCGERLAWRDGRFTCDSCEVAA